MHSFARPGKSFSPEVKIPFFTPLRGRSGVLESQPKTEGGFEVGVFCIPADSRQDVIRE